MRFSRLVWLGYRKSCAVQGTINKIIVSCVVCKYTSAENRKSQVKFACIECQIAAPADLTTAIDIYGQYMPGSPAKCTVHGRRQQQKPTEGIYLILGFTP